MKYLSFFLVILFSGCNALPGLFQSIDDIATDTAVKVELSRDVIQKETDLDVTVSVRNKDLTTVK